MGRVVFFACTCSARGRLSATVADLNPKAWRTRSAIVELYGSALVMNTI